MSEQKPTPLATPTMAKVVSQYRREKLENEIDNGVYRESGSTLPKQGSSLTSLGQIKFSAKSLNPIEKTAATSSVASGYQGPGGTVRQTPEVYSPLWLNSNLNLPRDKATINAWCRAFFALNPIVQNAISLHSTYPISKLNIKCKNAKVNAFFENMIDEIDLMNVCVQIAQEYWCLGETFVYTEMDESSAKWRRILIQNPDYITVKRSIVANEPIISLRPDENFRRICTGNSPSDIQQRQQLDPSIVEHVRRGENIPISNFYISHLARKISPYDSRGTGLPVSCFRQLMLFDQLRESKYVQASSFINPLTLVKVGGGADNYKPTPQDLEAWKQVFEEARYDKDFKIFTHDAVNVEPVGFGGGIYDISNDVTQIIKEIYIGLMVPQVLMDGGADVTYANGGVALDVLRQRYMQFRNMLSSWLRRKIFAPISKINDFYEYVDGEKVLIVPDVEWNHMSLFDMGDYIQNLTNLVGQEQKKVSVHTLYRSLGLDYEEEQRRIRKENIDMIISAKELEQMQRMTLHELRSIGESDEIQEKTPDNIPGQTLPGEGGAGLGDLGGMGGGIGGPPGMGGGLPGMSGPPSGGLGGPPGMGGL